MSGEPKEVLAPLPAVARSDRWLLLAALAGPSAWLVQFGLAYGLVGPMCVGRTRLWLHLATAVALAATALGAAHCWRSRIPGDAPRAGVRSAVAWGGIGLSLFFALLVVGTDIPGWLLDPCSS